MDGYGVFIELLGGPRDGEQFELPHHSALRIPHVFNRRASMGEIASNFIPSDKIVVLAYFPMPRLSSEGFKLYEFKGYRG